MEHRTPSIRSGPCQIAVGLFLVFMSGCSTVEPSPSTVPPTAPQLSAEPTLAAASINPTDLSRWVAFRKLYGLRSDLAWVTQVASDPANTNEMDVPLLPAEIDIVASQNRSVQELMPAVIAYGEGFPDYAGARIEGTKAILLFRDRLVEHRKEVDQLFGPGRIEVRKAPYSITDLGAYGAQVEAERDWFASIGVELVDAEPYELTNTVRVRYIAKDKAAEPVILEHFGKPEWLTLKWYGPPPWTGPWGRLVVQIVDPAGRPLPGAADPTCTPVPVESSVLYSALPTGTVGSGRCVFDHVPAVAWDVEVAYIDAHDAIQKLSRRIVVPANGTGSITVVIDR